MYIDQSEKALQYSQVALERSPEKVYFNESRFNINRFRKDEEAYEIFNDLLRV